MGPRSNTPILWWDREYDQTGKPIRSDVRAAAHKVWPYLSYIGAESLRDFEGDGPALMEKVIETVSTHLDAQGSVPHDPSGLIVVSFRHELYKLAAKQNRTVYRGDATELSDWLQSTSPASLLDQNILAEEVFRLLRTENQAVLRLRIAGYEWKEIGRMLRLSPSTVRNDFWRDVKRAYAELVGEKGTK